MRKEVENVISGGVKQTVVNSNDFKKFLTDHGLYEKEYAPRSRKGIAVIDGKSIKFDVTAENKIGDTKTVTYESKKYTATIEDIETIEENIENYPYMDASNTENYGFHYQEVPMTLTKEEETALYDYYTSILNSTAEMHKTNRTASVLIVTAWIIAFAGFIAGIVVAVNTESVGLTFLTWAITLIQVMIFAAIIEIIILLDFIRWQQSRK